MEDKVEGSMSCDDQQPLHLQLPFLWDELNGRIGLPCWVFKDCLQPQPAQLE